MYLGLLQSIIQKPVHHKQGLGEASIYGEGRGRLREGKSSLVAFHDGIPSFWHHLNSVLLVGERRVFPRGIALAACRPC